jgi:hypothetical protein
MDYDRPYSLFDRTVSRPRPAWLTVALVMLIYFPLLVAAIGWVGSINIFGHPRLRAVLTAPTIIAYILLIAPVMKRMGSHVIESLRPVILADDGTVASVIRRGSSVPLLYEIAGMLAGLLFGMAVIVGDVGPGLRWPLYVEIIADYVMCALLGWLAVVSLASSRVINALLRLPTRVDPLDLEPFEAIGRHSLVIAMAFIGGITIGLVLGNYGNAAFSDLRFWLFFAPLFLLPVAIFFLNMIPTHRVLAQAKERELDAVQYQMRGAFRALLECRATGMPAGSLAQEASALAMYEQRLQQARTWPYNTAILRALFFSILVPVVTVLARRVAEFYIR